MVRTFVTSLLILLLASSGVLLWQWNVYSNQEYLGEKNQQSVVEQRIQIQQSDKSLQVSQTMSGLKKGSYTFENLFDTSVSVDGKKVNNRSITIKEDDKDVTFNYTINFNEKQKGVLLQDWALQLEHVNTKKTQVEVTVEGNRVGSWAAVADQVGKVKKTFVDYYVFEGEGSVYPLYYQQGELLHHKTDEGSTIYFENTYKQSVNQVATMLKKYPELKDSIVILTSQHQEKTNPQLLMLNNTSNAQQLNQKMANLNVETTFPFKNSNEKWQQHIIGDIYFQKTNGSLKAKEMRKALEQSLYTQELQNFISKVHAETYPLTSARLDTLLSDIKGKKTSFFELNKQEQGSLVPLYYEDGRVITVNQQRIEGKVYEKNDQLLLPFLSIMSAAGYSYDNKGQDHILLTKDGDSLRMYPNKNVFMLNGIDYSLTSSPLTVINGAYYLTSDWFEDIFGMLIVDADKEIMIKTE